MPANNAAASRLINRNVIAGRGRTSMRLEPEFWTALTEICHREQIVMAALIRRIETHEHAGGRTSAVRVFVLEYYRAGAMPSGYCHDPDNRGSCAV